MNTILEELNSSNKFIELENQIKNKKSPIAISGLTSVSEVMCIARIVERIKNPILLITYNEIQAKNLVKDFSFFTDKAVFLPKKEIVTYDYVAESKNLPYERIEVLNKIYENKNIIIVTSIEALNQKIIAKDSLYKNVIDLKVGENCNLDILKEKLIKLGYERFDLIDGRGEFSVRGGIIDVSINENMGIRIELWGDEIDSIRYFSIISQRSTESIEKISIYPAHEYILEEKLENVAKSIEKRIFRGKTLEIAEKDIEEIKAGNYLSKVDKYFNSFYKNSATILEYFSKGSLIFVDEISKIEARCKAIAEDEKNTVNTLLDKERMISDSLKNTETFENFRDKLKLYQTIYLNKFDNFFKSNIEKYDFNSKELNYFKSDTDIFIDDIRKFIKDKKKVHIVVDLKEKADKIIMLLQENEIPAIYQEKLNNKIIGSNNNTVIITKGVLSQGFLSYELNVCLITANELVSAKTRDKKRKSEVFKNAEKVVFADLKVGDYVVHRKYGIGIYIGVNTIEADGTVKDYIKLKYAGDAILYIPTNALDSIRKYVGGEELNLKLNSLGSKDWEKTTNKVKNNLRAVAKELIELYARRERAKGFAFSPDNEWQKQFEESFHI